ncbi:MAG: TolC family protein [Pseudomonadota bacterium]
MSIRLLVLGISFIASSVVSASAQTVEDAIFAALQHSPQIALGEADTDAARATQFGALGELLPSVSASVTAGNERWRSDELERLRAEDGVTYSLEFSQPVFQGGSAYFGLKDARASTQAQRLLERENRQLVAEAAATAHAALMRDREIVSHRTRSLDLLMQQVMITDQRREAGAESLIAVSQARSRMEQERAELVRAEASLAVSAATYLRQTGDLPGPVLVPDTKRIEDDMISAADAIAQAFKSNPGLLARDDLVSAAQHGQRSARGKIAPSLSLDGQYNAYDLDASAQTPGIEQEDNEFQLVARLRVPLFQKGQNYSDIKSARARLARENAARRDARLAVEEAVTANWNTLQSAAAAIEAAKAAVMASEIVVEGQQAEYESGRTGIQDVLDGQRDLVLARISLSQAEFDYRRARYGLLALVDRLAPAQG